MTLPKVTVVLLIAFALLACTNHPRSRCQRICVRETECAEEMKVEHDKSECLETCTSLDHDPNLSARVERHAKCVENAKSCEEIMACP